MRYGAFARGKRFRRHSHFLPIPYGHEPARVHPGGTQDAQNGVGDFPGNCYMTRPINGDTGQKRIGRNSTRKDWFRHLVK